MPRARCALQYVVARVVELVFRACSRRSGRAFSKPYGSASISAARMVKQLVPNQSGSTHAFAGEGGSTRRLA